MEDLESANGKMHPYYRYLAESEAMRIIEHPKRLDHLIWLAEVCITLPVHGRPVIVVQAEEYL